MRQINLAVLGASLLASFLTAPVYASQCNENSENEPAEEVRTQRDLFSQAIAGGDIDAVSAILSEDVILITGTDSDIYQGRDAQVSLWREDFASIDRAIYVRTSKCIHVSSMAPIALEYGVWRGAPLSDVAIDFAAGGYAAKWRRIGETWRLESEIFSTETCGGRFCPEGGKTTP